MGTILSDKHEFRFFGRRHPGKIKSNREIYAIKANRWIIEKAGELREMHSNGTVVHSLGGHLLNHCLGIPVNPKVKEHLADASQLTPMFTDINDLTTDIDTPGEYARLCRCLHVKPAQPVRVINQSSKVPFKPPHAKPVIKAYYTIDRLKHDLIHELLPKIPDDVDLIIGIPRDGMIIAYLISIYRNIPFCDLTSFCAGIIPKPGIKHRDKEEYNSEIKTVLMVDDICASGQAMRDAKATIAPFAEKYKIYTATLYASKPEDKFKAHLLDFYGLEIAGTRHYEWTHCDAVHLPGTMMDIDGVLCPDCLREEDDDGERYRNFLINTPLKIRPQNIGWLITWRRKKYRELTEAWLKKHGITYGQLIMADRDKWKGSAEYKAHHYKQCGARFFIDSSSHLAEQITRLSGKPAVGFDTNEVFGVE
jgi:hypoxanthine phosphoribosyltransferase